jgi:surface protein
MKGLFQNCESIETLNLTNFYTPNVEIMWDMFYGCNKLINLSIPNFDTSKVTDMQPMFSGYKNLLSLDLNHFNTTNVQYMNEMFKDCENLKYVSMSQISSNSLSTMYRMFYNCSSLEYLNIFTLTEDFQSITEMFNGTPNNFTVCIKEKETIPNIFNLIYDKINRDCSENCYGKGKGKINFENEKRCCSYIYNGSCYNQ